MRYNDPYADYDAKTKILHAVQDIWPKIYKALNELLFGIIHFVVDTISGLWRRY